MTLSGRCFPYTFSALTPPGSVILRAWMYAFPLLGSGALCLALPNMLELRVHWSVSLTAFAALATVVLFGVHRYLRTRPLAAFQLSFNPHAALTLSPSDFTYVGPLATRRRPWRRGDTVELAASTGHRADTVLVLVEVGQTFDGRVIEFTSTPSAFLTLCRDLDALFPPGTGPRLRITSLSSLVPPASLPSRSAV